jgi:hypothetical protein
MDEQNDKIDSSTIAGRLRQATGSPQYAKRSIIIPRREDEVSTSVQVEEISEEHTEPEVISAQPQTSLPISPQVTMVQTPVQPQVPVQNTVEDLHSQFGIEREAVSGGKSQQKGGFFKKLFGKKSASSRRK